MAYSFGRVDLRLFDFHLSLSPLLASASLNKPMAFLGSPDSYRDQFTKPPFPGGDFRVRPLSKKSRLHHHFWKYYSSSFDKLDPWQRLLPFVCEPTKDKLSLAPVGAGVRAFARPATYLFPFGWSNTIDISLQGSMTPAVVQQFIATLRRSKAGPFQLGGKSLGLSAVFAEYSNRLKRTCFVDATAAADLRRVDRYLIVSISKFAGSVAPYYPRNGSGTVMPVADKALLHSLLLGEDVPMAQIAAADNPDSSSCNFLVTRYQDAGFALSYFDRGTLLFLQDIALNADNPQVLRCVSSNILLCLMMMRSLLAFFNYPDAQSADPKSLLGQTRDAAKQQLLAIPSKYTNPLCQTWFQYYGPWKDLKTPDKPAHS
jgi:hypothetical protein